MSAPPADAFEAAVDRLYRVAPAEFTATRAALAADARSAGDRDLAARIGALAKPTAAADLANRIAHDAPEDLDELGALRDAVRQAQEQGDRMRLGELSSRRRSLLAEVVERAAERAEAGGKRPGAGVLEELRQTLQAALVSQDAARALRSGRLVRAIEADGLDPDDLVHAVAAPGTGRPERRGEGGDEARAREAARRAELQAAAREARRVADAAVERRDRARATVERHEGAVRELEQHLQEARVRLDAAESDLARTQDAADAAGAAADTAEQAAD